MEGPQVVISQIEMANPSPMIRSRTSRRVGERKTISLIENGHKLLLIN